jgi:hypothetical protein
MIQELSPTARIRVFYKTEAARGVALGSLTAIHESMAEAEEEQRGEMRPRRTSLSSRSSRESKDLCISVVQSWKKPDRVELDEEEFEPKIFGLVVPGKLLREAYIMRPDLSPQVGWETGRSSEPAFMDMNLNAVCTTSEPEVVLFQYDEGNPMNPHGLLIAYAEASVKPVVSDFDAFLIASRGMEFAELPGAQAELMNWSLARAEEIIDSPSGASWTTRWLEVLKRESDQGFHPDIPVYGFGDPTSYRLISDVVQQTSGCGAIRHGAECFNCYFPQELDEQYLVVWEGFDERPWEYKSESELRSFLIERVAGGFSFPLNPVWPVRDAEWYEVWEALRKSPAAQSNLDAWYPPRSGIVARIEQIHEKSPDGFMVTSSPSKREDMKRPSLNREEEACRGLNDLLYVTPASRSPTRRISGAVKQQMYTSMMNLMPRRRSKTEQRKSTCEVEPPKRADSNSSRCSRKGPRSLSPGIFQRFSTVKSSSCE